MDDPRGCTVLDGALGRRQEKVMSPGYLALRRKLTEDGLLVPHGDEQFRLTKTYVFVSPSNAASVLSGGSKNGRIEWRDADGRTLAENQVDTAPSPPPGQR